MGGDADLGTFRKDGLSGNGETEFNRKQLVSRFRKWKNTKLLAVAEHEERFIPHNKHTTQKHTQTTASSGPIR
eukprot:1428360-Ditylum_brightwellii.AAC.1